MRRCNYIQRLCQTALAAIALTGCAATGGPLGLSKDQQTALGRQEHPKIVAAFGGEIDDPEMKAYVEGIVSRLMAASDQPNEPIKTTVLDSPVVNAMALPGHVYVTRGLLALANSEAELAGVMGHEIGHIFEQHTAERVSRSNVANIGSVLAGIGAAILTGDGRAAQQTQQLAGQGAQLYLLRFSRTQEYEADQVGVRLLARAGYDPLGEAQFLDTLGRWSQVESQAAGQQRPPEFLSSHPNTAKRVQQAAAEAQVLGKGGEIARNRYLNRVDDLLYGDDPVKQGFVRGSSFYHPELGFGFSVPSDMKLVNSSQAVVAQSQTAQMQFLGATSQQGPAALVQQVGQQLKLQMSQARSFNANGRNAAYGSARANGQQGQLDVQVFAIQWDGPRHWVFMWITPANQTRNRQRSIEQSVQSLRAMTRNQMRIPPTRRVDVVTVQRGDTFNQLANLTAFENYKAERFGVMNGMTTTNDLKAGDRVKLVR
ncbi:MAG: M48 family metalloprotease [Pseudomonadota bacterium]